ncbi:hypothetical protein C5O75_010680 [Burkholderia cepacia]|nr:hypothetical protein C5O75_010680 [Burkholderia cepacia]
MTAAPRRGDANRPTRSQVLHDHRCFTTTKASTRPQAAKPERRFHETTRPERGQNKAHYPLPIEPVAIPQDACVTLT